MGGLSPWHIILVAVVALLLFGPNKLPELGRGFGKMFREFKDATIGGGSHDEPKAAPAPRKEINPVEPAEPAQTAAAQAEPHAEPQQSAHASHEQVK